MTLDAENTLTTPTDPEGLAEVAGSPARQTLAAGLVKVARPHQWLKNLLVFVAPGVAGVLLHGPVLGRTVAEFAIFCVSASGSYFLNDALDAEADRRHPRKRNRPVASGVVPVPLAAGLGSALLVAGALLAWPVAGWRLALVMALYGVVNVAYSLGVKHEPVLDLVAVSSGFVLRAVAGGVAAKVPLSNWFLIVASFGSLLIVTGKRSGEKHLLTTAKTDHGDVRQTLASYSSSFLTTVRTLSAAVTVTAYCLWAFERASQVHPGHDPVWFQLTIVPFVIALLHVVRLLDAGEGAAPEDLAIHDHRLQLYGAVWVGLFAVGLYLA
ncbi:MAG: decaprenyl-phosphate phosphoribosyltransferase [Actinomycetota bacterium]|jgi:decaprenyl-phosphate phosphoribosyltransferase|nr:decaprenyl-phosphate phosphoribosyltransferase [Actinomycetota bacterium]